MSKEKLRNMLAKTNDPVRKSLDNICPDIYKLSDSLSKLRTKLQLSNTKLARAIKVSRKELHLAQTQPYLVKFQVINDALLYLLDLEYPQ